MNRLYFITLMLAIPLTQLMSQSKSWEVYVGGNLCNVKHIQDGQQTIQNHTLNSPLWNFGYQLGVNKTFCSIKSMRLDLSAGLRIQLKGDAKSFHEVWPVDTFYGIRFTYAMLPVDLLWRIFPTKDIFIKSGVSADYLAHKQITPGSEFHVLFPVDDTFKEKWEFSFHLGTKFKIANNIYAEIMYSQGLTPIIKYPIQSQSIKPYEKSYKNQAFEFSMIYQL